MNKFKNKLPAFCIFLLLFVLILSPASSVTGAKNGLLLWFQVIIPTLLPFIFISNLMIQLKLSDYISQYTYPFLKRTLGVQKSSCYPIVIGLLSGYPVGAKACADLTRRGEIHTSEGQFILPMCNNASPMFIISFVSMENLGLEKERYFIWMIITISSIGSALIFKYAFQKNNFLHSIANRDTQVSSCSTSLTTTIDRSQGLFEIIDNTLLNSFEVLTKVGGYIILFSLMAQIIKDLPILPIMPKMLVIGALEITTGISAISQTSFSALKKIVIITALTAFGGLSSLAQTKSVITESKLSLFYYLLCKLLSGILAGTLAFLLFNIL